MTISTLKIFLVRRPLSIWWILFYICGGICSGRFIHLPPSPPSAIILSAYKSRASFHAKVRLTCFFLRFPSGGVYQSFAGDGDGRDDIAAGSVGSMATVDLDGMKSAAVLPLPAAGGGNDQSTSSSRNWMRRTRLTAMGMLVSFPLSLPHPLMYSSPSF
jgi:hypothetical protein